MKAAVRRLAVEVDEKPVPKPLEPTELGVGAMHPLLDWECCRDQVLLRCIEAAGDRMTPGGIALPDGVSSSHEAASIKYEVVLVGPDAKVRFAEGQEVILSQMAVGPVMFGGEELFLVSAEKIQMARRLPK